VARQRSSYGRIASQLDASRFLVAGGLTLWLGGLAAAVTYTRRRMRFPKSMYGKMLGPAPGWSGGIGLLISFAVAAVFVPTVAWFAILFASALAVYVMGAYVIALGVERRRAARLGLPEPGAAGTISLAESAVFLAIAVPITVAALALTVYGIVNEFSGNRSEGGAGLGLGAGAWFIALFMGLFGSPLLIMWWHRHDR
jgi:hypothetical protein